MDVWVLTDESRPADERLGSVIGAFGSRDEAIQYLSDSHVGAITFAKLRHETPLDDCDYFIWDLEGADYNIRAYMIKKCTVQTIEEGDIDQYRQRHMPTY